MPKGHPRIEVSLSHEMRRRLEMEKMEISARLKRNVSMSKLIELIIDQYFETSVVQEEERVLQSSQQEL